MAHWVFEKELVGSGKGVDFPMTDEVARVNKDTLEIKKKQRLNAVKLDKEEEFKNRFDILEAGQEDHKKGVKAVIQQQKEEKEAKDKKDADTLTELQKKVRWHESYKKTLANALSELLQHLDWIKGWTAYCLATDGSTISIKGKPFATKDGVLLLVMTPQGDVFHQGILTTEEPLLDYSALYTMAAQLENQMDRARGLLLSSKKEEGAILDATGQPVTNTAK